MFDEKPLLKTNKQKNLVDFICVINLEKAHNPWDEEWCRRKMFVIFIVVEFLLIWENICNQESFLPPTSFPHKCIDYPSNIKSMLNLLMSIFLACLSIQVQCDQQLSLLTEILPMSAFPVRNDQFPPRGHRLVVPGS